MSLGKMVDTEKIAVQWFWYFKHEAKWAAVKEEVDRYNITEGFCSAMLKSLDLTL